MLNTYKRKSLGRIYVTKSEDINHIKELIKEMDKFEYEYLPENFITHINDFPRVAFTGKFDDLDLDRLTYLSFRRGMPIFCYKNDEEEL